VVLFLLMLNLGVFCRGQKLLYMYVCPLPILCSILFRFRKREPLPMTSDAWYSSQLCCLYFVFTVFSTVGFGDPFAPRLSLSISQERDRDRDRDRDKERTEPASLGEY
jgi:hypothetical protein